MTAFQRIIKYCAVAFAVFLIVSIIGGICGAIGMLSYSFDGSGDTAGETRSYPVSADIKSLDVEVSAAALEIVNGDSFSLTSNHKYLSVKDDNGTLRISEEKKLFGVSSDGIRVTLTVPSGFVFENAAVSAGAGQVRVDTLCANTLDLDLGAGAAEIACLNVSSTARINGGTGKLTVKSGELHNLTADIGVGKLELRSKLTGRCSVDYGIGDAELTLLGRRDDYQIEIEKGVGSATLDGKAIENDCTCGTGANQVDIDGGIGSVHIRFEDAA